MSSVSRRHFLTAAALVAGTPAVARAARVRVDAHPLFQRAAQAHGVPVALLVALSYAQTRWDDHEGRPSSSLGYGPMHLVDGAAARRVVADRAEKAEVAVPDTLGDAARATGVPLQRLRTDPAANIDGAAAVLAAAQQALGRPTGVQTDPASWFGALAATSGLAPLDAQVELAEEVLRVVRTGTRLTLPDGSRLQAAPAAAGDPRAQRDELLADAGPAPRTRPAPQRAQGPAELGIEWVPAPYQQYRRSDGSLAYGNHDIASRPTSPRITHVVIHDVEGSYGGALNLVTDPTYASWQYTVRSSDGHIAQHVAHKDIAWQAGSWWMNSHSIGLEHEGYAARRSWLSEPLYRRSARLVSWLCDTYDIPKDRAHVIGHDQVPATTTARIPAMHWDPGPYFDWEHYFDLMGAPLRRGVSRRPLAPGDVVRILPAYTGNRQGPTGCQPAGADCASRDTGFVHLRTAPRADAPLVPDPGLHPSGATSTHVSDIGSRAGAGTQYVVAEVRGDWTAIWYLGQKAWLSNPRRRPTAWFVDRQPRVVTAAGASARIFGRCLPEASAYPNPARAVTPTPLVYRLPAGQQYVVTDENPPTAYYKASTYSSTTPGDHLNITGRTRHLQIGFGHRLAFVLADEVRGA